MGIPSKFIHWIKLCITTPSFSVQVNGELVGYFQSTRGLRQGCSLSPYLFVLYDLMIFLEGSKRSIEGALGVFDEFAKWSGLNISIEKSTVYMTGVKEQNLEELPVCRRCSPCEAATHQAVILSIVNFWAAVFRLPSQCVKEVEKLCASFLWSGPSLKSAGAKVAWKDICKPKEEGGLGIRDLKEVNVVYGLKIIWRLLSGDSLWGKWIKSYLLKRNNFGEVKISTQGGSWIWRKVLKLRHIAKEFYRVEVGNCWNTSFWFDKWSSKGILLETLGDRGITDMGIKRNASLAEAVLRRRRVCRHRIQLLNEV
ncbi:uncharacterized protein LOC108829696 [Raphanus sativus]|uniref:Uncharacterized protein LOC108829696 n=1 Tax=Raphanus sativus TaxID=3726 RepID=A0A9W3C765_RAPSA|nr:uncharacterized protein LOC108829696 [Raphanus sativus]